MMDTLRSIIENVKIAFLYVLGRIKLYKWPMFVVYNPRGYDVRGAGIRKAMSMARKGDVFLRRYRNYLDGYFIPGRFTHSGLYIGDGVIVHAMAGGVHKIDMIDFLRCDGYAIVRPSEADGRDMKALVDNAEKVALEHLGNGYDYDFQLDETGHAEKVYCHELVRKCYPDLDIYPLCPSLWNGIIRSRKKVYLAQSFMESPDMEMVYDSDFSETK